MINPSELRPGNYVSIGLAVGCERFGETILKLREINGGHVCYVIDYPDSDSLEDESSGIDSLHPVPLNGVWKNLLNVTFEYPSWIKSVHELQNWYYWNNEKRDLDSSKVPMSEGDNVAAEHLEELLKD